MNRKWKQNFAYRKLYIGSKKFLSNLFFLMPIQNRKIVFDNFSGKGYGCDPKYICEELRKRNLALDLVWLSQKENADVPEDVRVVKYGTLRALYEMATAHIWIDNVKTSIKPQKRKGQYYIQTWHSSLGLKKNEADAVATLTPEYIAQSQKDAAITDLMYANSEFRADRYRNAYWYKGSVITCGVPRDSILFSHGNDIVWKVKEAFGISDSYRIAVYAPTFRKDYRLDWYQFDYDRCLKALENKFGGKFILLLRLHPNAAVLSNELSYSESVKNASNYPDIQELLAVSDVLISDYSGCMFDFSFFKKPVFLYTPDLEQYMKNDRELYFSMDELPFELNESEQSLCDSIEAFSQEVYSQKCDAFFDKIGLHEDGQGSKVIADLILDRIEERK